MDTILPTSGIVYVLTHKYMPGLVKIGKSSVAGLEQRIKTLYQEGSGVPCHFDLHYALAVKDEETAYLVEGRMHTLFAENRVNDRREFFEVAPEKVVQALLPIIDVGGGLAYAQPEDLGKEDTEEEGEKVRERKNPPTRFFALGLKVGDILIFTRDQTKQCKVLNDREVEFQGETTSLSAITQDLLGKTYGMSGPAYWMYDGETLDKRRRDMENEGTYGT